MTSVIQPSSADLGSAFIGELASDLAAEGDVPDLMSRFLAPLLRLAGADAGAVRALSADGQHMQLISSVGLAGRQLRTGWTVQRDCGACGAALSCDTPTWASELTDCPQLGEVGHVGGDFQRMLAVPLGYRGQVLGVYSLFFLHRGGPGPEVLAVLKSVGDLLGLALNNARLEQTHLRAAVMAERHSMAAEVHDSVAQTLAFVKLRMPLLQDAIGHRDEAAALRYAADVRRAATDAHASLRELLTNFRAPVDVLGLRHALQASMHEFKTSTGLELEFQDRAPGLALSIAQEVQVSRIVQEALTNIAKHAQAQHAWLTLEQRSGTVEIRVEDDGRAAPALAAGGDGMSHGIAIMRERAGKIGGQIEIGRREGGGTCVRVSIPLDADGVQG